LAVAFLTLLLRRWFRFTRSSCSWRWRVDLRRWNFGLRLSCRFVRLRRWRQCHLLEFWFGGGSGQSVLVFSFRCGGRQFCTLGCQLSLPLTVEFAHVLRHL